VFVACNGTRRPTVPVCNPCLVQLECGCTLYGSGDRLNEMSNFDESCNDRHTESKIFHAVNLAVLNAFYEGINESLTGQALFNESIEDELAPLYLPLFSENVTRLLSADKSASYSLRKLSENLQNDSVIFHSPTEALLYDYINQQPDRAFWSWNHGWVSYAICGQYLLVILIINDR
jgi:hypothetical protein